MHKGCFVCVLCACVRVRARVCGGERARARARADRKSPHEFMRAINLRVSGVCVRARACVRARVC